MLDPKGLQYVDTQLETFKIYLCAECHSCLIQDKMPRLALNNHLFRGDLPDVLQDVTWIEEMICSLYRTTAHVTRIYASSSPSDPLVLHGNACAHPFDLCTTVRVLPWTPADVNGVLSVIFVGPQKLTPDDFAKLKPFHVRRPVIRMLLNFLCRSNRLYADLPAPDETCLMMYPENGILPGLLDGIVYD
ncbi:hypothetical protein C8J55DRAFT_429862, partial [Lentinula edodes]